MWWKKQHTNSSPFLFWEIVSPSPSLFQWKHPGAVFSMKLGTGISNWRQYQKLFSAFEATNLPLPIILICYKSERYERSRPLGSICFKRKSSSFLPVLMEHFHSLAPVLTGHFQLFEFRASRLWHEHAESNIQLVTFLAWDKPHRTSALSKTVSFLGKKQLSNSKSHMFKIIKHFLWS